MDRYLQQIILFVTILAGQCLAGNSLKSSIDSLLQSKNLRKVDFGIMVMDAESGQTLYSHNAPEPLIPASNMKVVTSASALKYLGKDFTYETKFYMQDGDLIIVGSGDPLLGDSSNDQKYGRAEGWVFEKVLLALKQAGVSEVRNVIVDSSVFDDNRTHPSWPIDQLNRYYSCQVSGLNYNGNCIEVAARNDSGNVSAWLVPSTRYVKLINKAKPSSQKKNTLWCSRPANSNTITLFGKCYKTAPNVKVTVDRPATYFAFLVAESLIKNDISVTGVVQEKYTKSAIKTPPLLTIETPLIDVMTRCNSDSFGLAAEALVKTISSQHTQGSLNGEWKHGHEMISRYLQKLDIKSTEYVLDDGSGLSKENKLSANLMCKVLRDIYLTDDFKLYKDTLAVGGVSGSSPVRSYFKDSRYCGKIFAKSGTISGVKALSGFVIVNDRCYIFSVLANKANGYTRSAINSIVMSVVDNAN